MKEEQRAALLDGWGQAVERSLNWR